MRIVGLGIDAVEIARIEGFLRSSTRNWAAGIFSVSEREQADEPPLDAQYYASRFAGKEAVSKALGTGFAGEITVHCIEIFRLSSGAPTVNVIGAAKELADSLGVTKWFISMTYSGGLAIVSVIAAGD
jgi:holo-[acyl-carrier protein] synthase